MKKMTMHCPKLHNQSDVIAGLSRSIYVLFILLALAALPLFTVAQNSPSISQAGAVDLIVESDSYTPPFYKGKALHAAQTRARIIALPHVGNVSAENLSYRWFFNGRLQGSASGVGKNVFELTDISLRSNTVRVEIYGSENNLLASAERSVESASPEVQIYENNPRLGVLFNSSLFTLELTSEPKNIAAFPFFVSAKHATDAHLMYAWRINGRLAESEDRAKNTLPLEKESGATGRASVSVQVSQSGRLFQNASRAINITLR